MNIVNIQRDISDPKVSIVIPCFNESAVIADTQFRLVDLINNSPLLYEVIYIDDGSTDNTLSLLKDIAKDCVNVIVVSFSRNFGHQSAVCAGLDVATGDVVCIIDADLQDPPELIPEMIALWRIGYDVVYGIRKDRKESLLKRMCYFTFYRIYRWLSHVDMPVDSGDFSLMDRKVYELINKMPENNKFLRGLRSWAGFKQIGISYRREQRFAGKSKYSFRKLLVLAFDGIFNFSTFPLSILFMLGFFMMGLSLFFSIILIAMRFSNFSMFGYAYHDVPGVVSILLFIVLFGGLQMSALGIVGEYIARIYGEVKSRPSYVVSEIIRH